MGATGCRRCQGAGWPCPCWKRSLTSCGCPRRCPVGLSRSRLGKIPHPEPCRGVVGSQPHMPHPSHRTLSPPGQLAGGHLPRSCRTSCGGCWARAGWRSWSVMCPVPGSGMGIWSC